MLITDVGEKEFREDSCEFYVAASRARKQLFVFIDREKLDLEKVINERSPDAFPLPNKEKQFALAMHGVSK